LVQLCAVGSFTSAGGVRVAIGKAPAATSTSMVLPFNQALVYRILASRFQRSAMMALHTLNVTEVN
jgi:hypothetical protein